MLKLFNKLNPLAFLVALCVGLFFCYVTTPTPKIVVKYPTLNNTGMVTYIDNDSNCYQYKAHKVNCPKDKSQISEYPVEDDE
jgi:hypothetical protein